MLRLFIYNWTANSGSLQFERGSPPQCFPADDIVACIKVFSNIPIGDFLMYHLPIIWTDMKTFSTDGIYGVKKT